MNENDYLKILRHDPCDFDDEDYGDEDQNTDMRLINEYMGKGDYAMDKQFVEKVSSLIDEIDGYEQVIANANGAMADAESELTAVLFDHEEASQAQ